MSSKSAIHIFASLVAVFISVNTALADDQPGPYTETNADDKRLIQTSPTSKTWMTESEISQLSSSIRQNGRFGGYMDITEHQTKKFLGQPFPEWLAPVDLFPARGPAHRKSVQRLLPQLSMKNLILTVTKLSSYRNRRHFSESGLAAAVWIRDQFATLARGRTDVTVELIKHSFKQPSVVARIAGKDPRFVDQIVVLGGHEDSSSSFMGIPSPTADAPGADKNASGVATLIEVFRILMENGFQPDRTIEFIAYAAGEGGLLGSQDVVQADVTAQKKIIGVLELNMTMFSGNDTQITLVNDYTDKDLTRFIGILLDTYVKIPWKETTCGFACGDHAAWNEAGYPVAFPFESLIEDFNPNILTANDIIRNLDPSLGLSFAKLATAFAVELSLR